MKKKNVIFIFITLLLFIINTNTVYAIDSYTIENGNSSIELSNYKSCSYSSGTSNSYVNRSVKNDNPFFFVEKVPTRDQTISLKCTSKETGKTDYVNLHVKTTAKIYENYNKNEESQTTYEINSLTRGKTFTGYKSCKANPTNAGAIDYISIENGTSGVTVKATKKPSSTVTAFLVCTTSDGRENPVNIRVPQTISTSGSSESTAEIGNADCGFILGDINNDGKGNNDLPSVAYVLNRTLKFIKILGPILVVIMTILDLVKAVTSGDKDALTKSLKVLVKRMVYAALLFIFPTILDLILKWTNVYGTCGIFGN